MTRDRLTDAKACTSDTVCDGTNPCELGLVDSEVWTAWTLQTLLVKNLLGSRRRERLCLDAAKEWQGEYELNALMQRGSVRFTVSRRQCGEQGCELPARSEPHYSKLKLVERTRLGCHNRLPESRAQTESARGNHGGRCGRYRRVERGTRKRRHVLVSGNSFSSKSRVWT